MATLVCYAFFIGASGKLVAVVVTFQYLKFIAKSDSDTRKRAMLEGGGEAYLSLFGRSVLCSYVIVALCFCSSVQFSFHAVYLKLFVTAGAF